MSGHNVPYQLRPNKFVERQLFLDLLDFVRVWNGPSHYIYASMGGRFLEDFKLVNDRFAIEQMISIELDETTWNRQRFNRLGFIDCRKQSSGEFIADLDLLMQNNKQSRMIVWLDYAIANKRGEQLGEFRQLVSKLASGDVAKITLNANSQSFRRANGALTRSDFDKYLKVADSPTHSDYDTYIRGILAASLADPTLTIEKSIILSDDDREKISIDNLKDQLGEYVPSGGISQANLEAEGFARFLSETVRMAALKGTDGSKLNVIPLGAFRYKDGEHQMLTVTTLIADEALSKRVYEDSLFGAWPQRAMQWGKVMEVNVPDLSTKERHHIEGLIASSQNESEIHEQMPFRFDKRDAYSLSMLSDYLRHYRRYPAFVRIQ